MITSRYSFYPTFSGERTKCFKSRETENHVFYFFSMSHF
uniref:Uncharacterized protein n=1 Tax=Anguilla anguilla TaxID=7936 RepID=A0A0E9WJM8_ANGAN